MLRTCRTACFVASMFATAALAAPQVLYDENNSGFLQAVTPLGLLDLSEGNFVMVQPGSLTSGDIGTTFLMRFQTRMDGVIFDSGALGFTFPGEVTVEFVAPLEFVAISGDRRDFALDTTVLAGPGNFLNVYHDTSMLLGNSSISTGAGFNDGTLTLAATFIDLFYSVDTTDLPGTFLAELDINAFTPTAFSVPAGFTARLDGSVRIPGTLPASASIVGYSPLTGDILGSTDLTMTFIPEANTLALVGFGALTAFGFLWRRQRS